MKKFLLSCAVLPVFYAGLQAQAPGRLLTPEEAVREHRIAERFHREYESRYRADYASVIRELSGTQDPDASALLAYLMMTDAYSLSASDAAYGLGKRLKDPAGDLSALGFLKLGLENKSGYVRFGKHQPSFACSMAGNGGWGWAACHTDPRRLERDGLA